MKRRVSIIAGIGAALLFSVATLAQQPQEKQPPQPGDRGGQMMSMDDMMKGCREHCQATTKSIDQMMKLMDDAKASSDPAKMSGALDQAQKPLADMKDHMGMCMNMMNMMEKMHGGMMQQKPPENRAGPRDAGNLNVTFRSQPTPPRSGENEFEVTVKDRDGQAITDADVLLTFSMPAMPSMNMPEMRNTVKLPRAGNGVYRGSGNVAMAGRWDVTVTVERAGERLGTKQLTVVAR